VLIGASALPIGAHAQSKFPERPIKLIVPWGAGGPADAGFRKHGRAVQHLRERGENVAAERVLLMYSGGHARLAAG